MILESIKLTINTNLKHNKETHRWRDNLQNKVFVNYKTVKDLVCKIYKELKTKKMT